MRQVPAEVGDPAGMTKTRPPLSERGSAPKVDSMLRLTTAVFATVYFVHGVDHLRRGLDFESTPIIVIGIVQTLLVVFAVVLVATRSRRAPLAAVGTVNAAGFTLQHVLPAWFGPLSDSFIDGAATPSRERLLLVSRTPGHRGGPRLRNGRGTGWPPVRVARGGWSSERTYY
jgi:hypothetical protein